MQKDSIKRSLTSSGACLCACRHRKDTQELLRGGTTQTLRDTPAPSLQTQWFDLKPFPEQNTIGRGSVCCTDSPAESLDPWSKSLG